MNWELIIAGVALISSIFSFGFTHVRTKKSDKEKVENYRYKLISKIQTYIIDIQVDKPKIESRIDIHFNKKFYNSDERNVINSTKDYLLPRLEEVYNEFDDFAKKITDYKIINTMGSIRKLELKLLVTERKYEILKEPIDNFLSLEPNE